MNVSAIQPSDAKDCQATTMIAGRIHPTHDRTCGTLTRSIAAKSRGPTLAIGLSAMSVNPLSWARTRLPAALGVALPRPNNVPDAERRRNQSQPLEPVGDSLLLGEDVVIERPKGELRPIDRSLLRREINAACLGEDGCDLIAVLVSPCRCRQDCGIDGRNSVCVFGCEVAVDQKE